MFLGPELFCGFPRSKFFRHRFPIPPPVRHKHAAGAAALLLVRSLLGLMPNMPQRSLTVVPALPKRWGTVALTDLRELTLNIEAEGETAPIRNLPDDWQVTTVAPAPTAGDPDARGLSGE